MLAAVAALAFAAAARADSIWARGHRRSQAIYADDTARYVGDILTIVINEQTKIESETSRSLDKKSSRSTSTEGSLDPGNLIAQLGKYVFDFPRLLISSSDDKDFEGGADYGADRSLTDKISVVVEDTLPNGNMVVLGTRTRNVAGESQIIQVSGLVRPSDVSITNEVSSEKVADFHIVYLSRGQENSFVNPGWLARILNFLNPL
jgi:flagellar L-ring protein precursor FlgH